MMRLYIVRHGPAVDIGDDGVETDFDRMLSKEGVEKTRLAAKGLRQMNCKPWRILTSPLVRAYQTAEILQEVLMAEEGVEVSDKLAPGTSMQELIAWVQELPAYPIMVVGHMPDLADLATVLVSGENGWVNMTFKKAAACCITFDEDVDFSSGCLDWLLQPRHLRALAQ